MIIINVLLSHSSFLYNTIFYRKGDQCSSFYLLSSYFTYKAGSREKDFTVFPRVLSSIDQGHGLSFLKCSLTKKNIHEAVLRNKSSTSSIFFSFNTSLDCDKILFITKGVRLKFWMRP